MKLSLRIILPVLLCAVALCARAENADSTATIVDRINESQSILVVQPAALQDRLIVRTDIDTEQQPIAQGRLAANSHTGFRIQIFDSNARGARNEAQGRKRAVESRFAKMRAYVSFDSPYWRVRVGDFQSRAEAEHALTELRRAFPGFGASFRIVRDRIN